MVWILGDLSASYETDRFLNKDLEDWWEENLGRCVVVGPADRKTKLDFTGPPGSTSAIYFSLCFQLRKWEYQVQKADEALEVTPIHAQYYQLTMKQKEELETKIKTGLGNIAEAISGYELLKHDERKYREFLNYFEAKDEHALRAVFIDQVDVHTGDVAMRTIVQRWPTLIADFMRLSDEDTDPDKVKAKLGISKAEAVVLVTKNKLYLEWKKLFLPQVKSRLERIEELIRSREKSISEYREWLKPYIVRHKLLKQAFESPEFRKASSTSFIRAGGHAVSTCSLKLWAWRNWETPELRRPAAELAALKPIDPYDEWTKKELIWHPKHGLVVDYPWITPTWVDEQVKWIKANWLVPWRYYYSFFEINFDRTNARLADGTEIEDGVFEVLNYFFSQNAMLVKCLELRAKQEEIERYVDQLIGIKSKPEEEKKPVIKIRKFPELPIKFFKRGPYESNFEDRITKYHLKPMAELRYAPVVAFLKEKMGIGR
jgi:hypothetical protein